MKKVLKQIDINSSRDTGKVYKVTFYSDSNVKCSCPHSIYRNAICKHIIKASEYLNISFSGIADPDDSVSISSKPPVVVKNILVPTFNEELAEIQIPENESNDVLPFV